MITTINEFKKILENNNNEKLILKDVKFLSKKYFDKYRPFEKYKNRISDKPVFPNSFTFTSNPGGSAFDHVSTYETETINNYKDIIQKPIFIQYNDILKEKTIQNISNILFLGDVYEIENKNYYIVKPNFIKNKTYTCYISMTAAINNKIFVTNNIVSIQIAEYYKNDDKSKEKAIQELNDYSKIIEDNGFLFDKDSLKNTIQKVYNDKPLT
jgi:hypothetical protein